MSLLKDIYKKLTGSNKKSSKKSAGKSGGKKSSQSKAKQKKSNTSTKPKTPAKSPSRAVQSYQNNANKKTTSPSQTLWGSYADRIAQNNKAQQEKRDQLKKQQEQQRRERKQKQLADANKAKRERIAKEKEQKRRESIDKNARIIAETKKQKDEYYKSKDWRNTKKQIKNSTIANERIALEKQGKSTNEQLEWLQSKKGKKETKKNYKTAKDATKAEINKKIDKAARDSVNKQIKAKDKKQETIDSGDLTYMSRADGAFHTTGEIEANQIQGAKAYADAHKTTAGRVAMGAISAFTPTSYSEETGMARDVYTDKQKKELLKNKEKTSYKVGEFAGNALAFALPGVAGAKKADAVLKGTKTLGGRALNLAKRTGIETAYNTPMNAYQALKGARDENGDLSLENYGKSLGLNTAMDLGMGAGMNAVMGGADKVLGKRYIDLLAKAESGTATEKDLVNLDKLKNLFAEKSKVASNVTANSEKIQSAIKNTDDVVAHVKSDAPLSKKESDELINLKAKEKSGNATVADKARIADLEGKAEAVIKERNIKRTQTRVEALDKLSGDTGVKYKMVSNEEMHAKAQELDKEYNAVNEYNGVKFKDADGKETVLINKDSDKSFFVTVGHETLHAIKGADDAEYKNLSKLINDFAKENDAEGYEQLMSAMKRDYSGAEIDEEMTAELVGKYLFGDDGEKFIQSIATKEPNIFKKIYDYVMRAFGKEDPQLGKVRDSFEKIYRQMGGESKTNGKAEFSATKKNKGYHAGDLGKSESLAQQSGGRGTGHFGTGTYFVGDKARIEGYNTRDGKPAPVETVDFTDYNLYKPKDYEQGYQLHSFLKGINEYYDTPDNLKTGKGIDDVVEQADDIDRRLFEASGEHEEMYWDDDLNDWFFVPAPRNEMAIELAKKDLYELAEKNLGKYRIDDIAKVDPDADADDFLRENGWVTSPEKMSDETTQKLLRELSDDSWHSWQDMARDRAEFFEDMERMIKESGLEGREKEISDALSEIREELQDVRYPQSATHDSASTMLMKKLGYEGIDVRGIDQLDNTKYGSVIYDLKGDALKRKQEIGTAKFSKQKYNQGSKWVKDVEVIERNAKTNGELRTAVLKSVGGKEETALKKLNTYRYYKMTSEERDNFMSSLKSSVDSDSFAKSIESSLFVSENDYAIIRSNLMSRHGSKTTPELYQTYANGKIYECIFDGDELAIIEMDGGARFSVNRTGKNGNIEESGRTGNDSRSAKGYDDSSEQREKNNVDGIATEGKGNRESNTTVGYSKNSEQRQQIEESKPPTEGGSFNSAKETSNDGVAVKNDGVKKDEVPYRLTADEETYKKASVSTKSLTNMTNEQLEKELASLEYVKKNKGKTPEHQRLRDERMKAIRGELLARKKEAMKKPTREMIASADDLENSANGEFRDDISRLGKETKKATQSFYRLFVDTFSGFEKYASTLPKEMRKEVQSAVNSLRNARNKAGGWVTEGRVLDGKVVGKPLKDIMGDLLKKGNSEKYLAFQDYAFNLHNIDRANSGKEVFGGVSAEESKAIVDELARKYPEFENIQKEINDYFKDLQQYRVETGLASKDTVDYLDALYPNYVPTYRLREPAPANDFAKGNANVDQIYKVAKGGDQKVIPLHEQITNQTEYTLKMGEQNRLFSTIAKMQGFEAKDIDPNVTINDAVQASLIPVRTTDGATYKHKVTFFDNGEPKTVEINQQMYDGILEWRKDKATLVDMFNWKSKPLRGMQRANSLFKNLITGWNPLFGITNIVKDTGEALLYTKNVFGFIKSYPKAVSQILRKGEYFKLYEANGGKYSHLRDVLTTFDTSKFKKWSNPIQWCQSFNDTLEAIPRMAEFISTVDKRTNGDLSKMDSKIANEALMNANEVTLNFGRKGIYGHAMNSTAFPYLNPAIQGVDKLIRVFREAGADGVKGIASLSAKIAAFAVVPAVANEIFMEHFGGQDYQDLNSRDKDNFFFVPMGDGKFIKIPKSRVGSALASPAMHFFRYAQYGDDMEWKQMFETAWDNVGVSNPLESSLFSPLALAYMNKTWYGGSIESMSDADLRAVGEAGKIYDSTTSAIAIWIGGKTNISPKKIDYIIDAYTGVIGDIALPYTAEASQGNPLAKKFIMDSVFSNDLSTSFWDKNASMESMSKVKGGKNTDKYNDWKSTYMYDALTLNDAVKAIDADKNLTKAEKAKLKRGIKIQLNNVYRSAVNGEPCDVEPISVISDAIGADKALSMYLPTKKKKSGTDTWGDYYKAYKKSTDYKNLTPKQREANAKKFLNVYSKGVEVQKAIDATDYHDRPDWGTTGVVIAELQKQGKLSKKQANTISESCGVWESSMKAYGKYMKFDGNTKRYVVTQKRLNKMYESMEIDTGTGIWKGSFGRGGVKGGAIAMQLSTSKVEFADRAYYISNYSDENMMLKMNASRGFAKKYGHTTEEIIKMANKADKNGDSNTYLSQGEVRDYCDNMKGNSEEKAMAFVLLGGNPNKNPYGSIGDYSSKRDTGITADVKESSGGRGRRRGGYGHHGGGGGGGKGSDDWMAWLEEQGIIGGTTATGGTSVKIKDNTSESALNDAYRKRVRKLMTNK